MCWTSIKVTPCSAIKNPYTTILPPVRILLSSVTPGDLTCQNKWLPTHQTNTSFTPTLQAYCFLVRLHQMSCWRIFSPSKANILALVLHTRMWTLKRHEYKLQMRWIFVFEIVGDQSEILHLLSTIHILRNDLVWNTNSTTWEGKIHLTIWRLTMSNRKWLCYKIVPLSFQ